MADLSQFQDEIDAYEKLDPAGTGQKPITPQTKDAITKALRKKTNDPFELALQHADEEDARMNRKKPPNNTI
jgi:hypothetical protein